MTGYAVGETPLGQQLGREDTELEPGDVRRRATLGPANSGRRVLLAIAVMIALLGGAAALSIWRYQVALDGAAQAELAHVERFRSRRRRRTSGIRTRPRTSISSGSPRPRRRSTRRRRASSQTTDGLGTDSAKEQALVAQARAANVAFVATFKQHLGAYERPAVVNALEALSDARERRARPARGAPGDFGRRGAEGGGRRGVRSEPGARRQHRRRPSCRARRRRVRRLRAPAARTDRPARSEAPEPSSATCARRWASSAASPPS